MTAPDPAIRALIDRLIVPALLERFLREQATIHDPRIAEPPRVECRPTP